MKEKNMHAFSSSGLRRAGLFAGAMLVMLLAGCQSGRIGNAISPSQENDMGHQAAQSIDGQAKFVTDGAYMRRMLTIAQPVFAQAMKERPDVSFRLRVIDDPELNAFSIPGGYIYLYRGLVDKLGNDDDAIACVIGHEAAHVVRRHVVKQMSDAQGKGILVDLASILSRSNAVNQIGGTLYELDQLHYSRGDEYEADRWGERFAYNAQFDPSGMVRTMILFEKLEKESDTPPSYSLDHPVSRNRALRALEQLRELRANNGQYISEAYDPNGDKTAARKHDISYQALVLATTAPVLPAITASDRSEDKAAAKSAPPVTPPPTTAPAPPVTSSTLPSTTL